MGVEQIDKLISAEDILLDLYWEMRDGESDVKAVKRLDTILGKIDQLIHYMKENRDEN